MTAALATFLADPWFDAIAAACLLCIVLCVRIEAHSRSIDAHTRQHRESDECPWCAASDERLLEREEQRWRADIAKRNREAAERRMRGAS